MGDLRKPNRKCRLISSIVRAYQVTGCGKGYRPAGTDMTVCKAFDGTVTVLRDGRELSVRQLAQGEEPAPELDLGYGRSRSLRQSWIRRSAVFGSHRTRKTPASQRGHFCFALTDDEDAVPVTPSCVTVLHPTMERPEMEPVTTIGLGAVAAYVAKDGIGKLLGPTADYLGEGLRDLTRRRVESIERIFSNASTKLGSQLDEPGQVPPRVLKTVLNEGSYCEDPVALEYFGGVLASSRTERGRDDRGARVAKVVDNLSTYQLRTHYLIYSSIANLFATSGRRFGTDQDRAQMQVFLPLEGYANAMGFSQEEWNNPQIMNHVWHGLLSDGLIEGRWQFGDQRSLRSIFAGAPSDGIVCCPSALGAELFLWALGHGNVPLEHLLSGTLDATIEGLPDGVPGAIAVKT